MINKKYSSRNPFVYKKSFLKKNNTVLAYASSPLHKHEFWEFVYWLKGTSENVFDNITCNTMPGQVLFIRPNDAHENIVYTFPYSHRDIYITCEELNRIADSVQEGLYQELLSSTNPIMFEIDFADMMFLEKMIEKSYVDVCLLNNAVRNAIVATLLGLYVSHENSVGKKPDWIDKICVEIDRMILDMEKGDNKNISSLFEMSKGLGYEYSYASRMFKKFFGVSPQVYYINKKMSLAALLLEQGCSVTEIATKLNYTSNSHFINAFKRYYGVSPVEWKKNRLS